MERIATSNATLIQFVLACALALSMLMLAIPRNATAADRVTTFDTFDTDEPYVALTFDVTFDRGKGEMILNTLAAYDVRATFAITGIWAQQNPDLVRRIANEGHGLMNHTWDHFSLTGDYTGSVNHDKTDPLTSDEIVSQLQRTEGLVQELTGVDMKPYVRPPYGDYTDDSLAAMANAGYTYNIMWTEDTLGWHVRPPEEVTQRALDAAEPGANLLMHIGHGSTDGDALPGIIEGLRAQGYGFATVGEFVEGRLANPDAPHLQPEEHETRERITQYWRENGGLLVFGYPLSEVQRTENGAWVQYFQRARLEQHPGPAPGEFEVHQADVDPDALRNGARGSEFEAVERRDESRCTTFEGLDFRVCGRLKYHWENIGGPPVSDELTAESGD